jgi:PEGA domain-containing protein
MRSLVRLFSLVIVIASTLALGGGTARAQHKMRIKIDSQPQQAAIYVDNKESGIKGYTPATLRLSKGTYTIILELPGFQPVKKPITVTRSEGFIFTLERAVRPATLDVRATSSNDAANGAQLFVDGAPVGVVPARVEVPAGKHRVEVKKQGYNDWADTADVNEGDQRQMVIDLQQAVKKGALLVTSDQPGADVFLDGVRKDSTPALISDIPEGQHSLEVKKGDLSWKQKVTAQLAPAGPAVGMLRIVCSVPGAEVWIDGEMKGTANSTIQNVPVGEHIVEVRARGFAPQSVNVTIGVGAQSVARVDLASQPERPATARLRVVTPVPNAEVFIDGASAGPAPFDHNDLAQGKHFVIVRARGYAEWKREVELDPAQPTTLSAELSASGTVKVLSNVSGAMVMIDGQVMGKTPVVLDNIPAGEHFVEVKQSGYLDAKQPFHLDGGEQKILAADLTPIHHGPTREDMVRRMRGMTSFSAVTIDPARFTADLAGGYVPFGQVRLTVGAFRYNWLGLDAGIELRTIGYFTEGLAHAKLQFIQAGPVAIAFNLAIGGGGGPTDRNDFIFEAGIPFTLLFGDLVRFTAQPYLQVYTDKNCPTFDDISKDSSGNGALNQTDTYKSEQGACEARDSMTGANGAGLPAPNHPVPSLSQDPRDRFVGARFFLQAVLEIAVAENVNIFAIFEGDAVGQRQALTAKFSSVFPNTDPQIYGRIGVTFKF